MAHGHARRRRGASRSPGLALATTVAPDRAAARSIAATLRVAHVAGERRLQRRVGAAGTAAQALVVELDDVGDLAEHGPHRFVGPLHVAQVARVLDDHRSERRRRAAAGGRGGRPATRGRRPPGPRRPAAVGCPEEVAVVLERGAAPGRVDDDRRVAGHRLDRALGQAAGSRPSPAWLCRAPQHAVGRDPERGAGRLDDGRRRPVRVAHPGVHHAAGVEPHGVGAGRRRRLDPAPATQRAGGPDRPASGPGAAAGRRRAASSRRAARDAGRARRSRPAASAAPCGGRRPALRGCPPSGGRTARRSGTPARSRGTGCTSP